MFDYLSDVVEDPTSALLLSGERALAAEFPAEAQARQVLGAIGSGERTHTLIGREAGFDLEGRHHLRDRRFQPAGRPSR